MDYSNFTKYDLEEPYNALIKELEFDEILKLQEEFSGRQILFPSNLNHKKELFTSIANCVGEKKAIYIMKMYRGERIYFHNIKRSLKNKICKLIIEEFDGYNYQELAKKYELSERHTRRIIKTSLGEIKTK